MIDFVFLSVISVALWFAGMMFVTMLLFGTAMTGSDAAMAGGLFGVIAFALGIWGVIFLLIFGYFTYLNAASRQTVGKRITGVRVVSMDGSPCTMKASAVRTATIVLIPFPILFVLTGLLSIIGLFLSLFVLVGWLGIELVVASEDDYNRRIGDQLAGTIVVTD